MTTRRDERALRRVRSAVAAVASGCLLAAASPAMSAPAAAEGGANAASVEATLNRYCVTCHNERIVNGRGTAPSMLVSQLRTAGLALDALDASHVGGGLRRVGARHPQARGADDAAGRPSPAG